MSYNKQLGSVLELLHLKLVEKDNFLYVLNLANEELSKVHNADRGLKFDFKIDDKNYNCEYNDRAIVVSNDQDESITISKEGIIYQRKNEGSSYNRTFAILSDKLITFYQNEDDLATSIKTYFGFGRMEKSTTLIDNGSYKEDITVEDVDDIPTEKHVIRKYNAEGSMVTGSLFDVRLEVPVQDYIKNELATNSVVSSTINQMNDFIPNLVTYCSYGITLVSQLLNIVNTGNQK